ncbi:Uncharacterized protein OBRU01_02199 [Operophtera brumata]|uniref:GTP-binding protein Rheb n=1 Tax=Operophtera brumata TaxID=104452 RepID=A0A0L7LSU2_OPEBR|nr:Uncharacterized protein OBRU01_02199 [Operophtera brumata]
MPSKQRKIAMMGTRSVGKSSLIIQFVEGQFVDSYDPTIENSQDEYGIFPQQYSMDFHGYVLVYSITSRKSFQIVQIIYDKLLDMVGKIHVPIVLVGNKTDLHLERKISTEEGKRLAEKWKAAFSVTDMFHAILSEIERSDGHVPDKSSCVIS